MLPYAALAFLVALWGRSNAAGIGVGLAVYFLEDLILFRVAGDVLDWVPRALLSENVDALLAHNDVRGGIALPLDLPSAWQAAGVLGLHIAASSRSPSGSFGGGTSPAGRRGAGPSCPDVPLGVLRPRSGWQASTHLLPTAPALLTRAVGGQRAADQKPRTPPRMPARSLRRALRPYSRSYSSLCLCRDTTSSMTNRRVQCQPTPSKKRWVAAHGPLILVTNQGMWREEGAPERHIKHRDGVASAP